MASFHLLFLALSVVSVYSYDLNIRPQYLPAQAYPSQNGYAVVYTTTSQLPVNTYTVPTYPAYSYQSYPANYVNPRQTYYTPYAYQPKDISQKVIYPVRGYAIEGEGVPSTYGGQVYPPTYSYQPREASQPRTYPDVYTTQQEKTSPMQIKQGQIYYSSYPYQTKESSPKVLFPFRGYATEQENVRTRPEQEYPYQTKEDLPKVTFPVRRYLVEQDNTPFRQEQAYPYQTKEAIHKLTYPVQGYSEGLANMRTYPDVYAPRYPEGYYQTMNQEYPKQEDSKNLRPNSPVIQVKHDSIRGYPKQHIKEEVMKQNRGDSWVNDDVYEKNAIKVDRN